MLFLQALTLEAGAWTVLQGVLLGFAAVVGVFFLVIALERRLPHKKMLVATGVLITWVLVVLVGQTVQTMQVVGWVSVTPIQELQLPYWSGVWFGAVPDVGGAHRPVRGRALRRRQLRRGRRLRSAAPGADPHRAGRATSTGRPAGRTTRSRGSRAPAGVVSPLGAIGLSPTEADSGARLSEEARR